MTNRVMTNRVMIIIYFVTKCKRSLCVFHQIASTGFHRILSHFIKKRTDHSLIHPLFIRYRFPKTNWLKSPCPQRGTSYQPISQNISSTVPQTPGRVLPRLLLSHVQYHGLRQDPGISRASPGQHVPVSHHVQHPLSSPDSSW